MVPDFVFLSNFLLVVSPDFRGLAGSGQSFADQDYEHPVWGSVYEVRYVRYPIGKNTSRVHVLGDGTIEL